MRFADRFRFDA